MDKHMAGMLSKVMAAKAGGKTKTGTSTSSSTDVRSPSRDSDESEPDESDDSEGSDDSEMTVQLAQEVLQAVEDKDADALADAMKQLVSACMDSYK
jgi:DNA-binding GntR family transcriptional regulator